MPVSENRGLQKCKVSDCYFDNQVMPKVNPIHWTWEQIEDFRHSVRRHNQIVIRGIDPELNPLPTTEYYGRKAEE